MNASATLGLARDLGGEAPRRAAAGRTDWIKLTALAPLRADWRDLSARALEPNVFYDPAFALAAAPVFGNPGAVLVWAKSGRLIGFFPCRVERRYGVVSTLTGWTHPYAPFGVPLVDRDEAEAAITGFLDHVEGHEKLPRLAMLPLVAREGAFAAALARVLARRGGAAANFGDHARALLAPQNGRANYLGHVGHKKLKELRRQRRRMDESAPVTHEVARDPQGVAAALADFMALEASGWKARSAAHAHPEIGAFMQGAVTSLAADGNARIDRLMQNGRALAATITLRAGNAGWFWKIAYDEEAARYSPGVQLALDLTGQLLADAGVARVDSCATADHPMIDHLWGERLALTDLLIAPSRAALAQLRMARPLETLRRALIAGAKMARDKVKRQA